MTNAAAPTGPAAGGVDAIALARALIRCPSVTPADAGALDTLQAALESIGFVCRRRTFSEAGTPDVDNLYARLGTAAPNFCFAGHTDVVPVGDRAAWSHDPFAARIVDGRLFGRGAADMKGAIAAFAAAVARLIASDGPPPGSISLLITGDEEAAAINGTAKMLRWLADEGEVLDACVVGEPTNPARLGEMIKIGRRGSMSGWLTVDGVQGHTAYPHLADNPVHRLTAMLAALLAEPLDDGSAHFEASTLQITSVDVGNPATNVIPAQARAAFNIRFNDRHTAAGLTAWLHAKLAAGGTCDLRLHISGESFLCPPGRLSAIVAGAAHRELGVEPRLGTTGGTSDARFIKDYCPVAEFGLVGQTMHKVDEHVATADIEALTRVYLAVLRDYFAAAP